MVKLIDKEIIDFVFCEHDLISGLIEWLNKVIGTTYGKGWKQGLLEPVSSVVWALGIFVNTSGSWCNRFVDQDGV